MGQLWRSIGVSPGRRPELRQEGRQEFAPKPPPKCRLRAKIGAMRATSVEAADPEGPEPIRDLQVGFLDNLLRACGTKFRPNPSIGGRIWSEFPGDRPAGVRAASLRHPDRTLEMG